MWTTCSVLCPTNDTVREARMHHICHQSHIWGSSISDKVTQLLKGTGGHERHIDWDEETTATDQMASCNKCFGEFIALAYAHHSDMFRPRLRYPSRAKRCSNASFRVQLCRARWVPENASFGYLHHLNRSVGLTCARGMLRNSVLVLYVQSATNPVPRSHAPLGIQQ